MYIYTHIYIHIYTYMSICRERYASSCVSHCGFGAVPQFHGKVFGLTGVPRSQETAPP